MGLIRIMERLFLNENPKEMEAMRKLGKRISVEAFEEVEDRTR